jgi:mRNA interferase MazF
MQSFLDWIKVKINLHKKQYIPPTIKEGDICWASLGENVGAEINGKGELFTRPVIIFKKLSKYSYVAFPTSTQIHTGRWYMQYTENEKTVVACLHQIRAIDYRRLSKRMGTMSLKDFSLLKLEFQKLYNPVSYIS